MPASIKSCLAQSEATNADHNDPNAIIRTCDDGCPLESNRCTNATETKTKAATQMKLRMFLPVQQKPIMIRFTEKRTGIKIP